MLTVISGKIFVKQTTMKIAFLFFIFTFCSCCLFGQADSTASDTTGIVIHKDPRLDLLVSKQAEINELTTRDSRRTGKGFRILIITTNKRDEAIAAKTAVYTYFPELKSYLWHQSPYYKVKAGNFKERKDAEAYQKKMAAYFPRGVFIMNDIVEMKIE